MAHPDLDTLLNALLPFAQKMLSKHGQFYPFGATLTASGQVQHVGAKVGDSEHPLPQSLIDLLAETFTTQARTGSLRAAGICYDGLTIPPGENQKRDAICCCLEHQSGQAVNVFLPYVKTSGGKIQYGEIFAVSRVGQFFPPPPRC